MREDIDPTAVFERDGWICGICGKKVNPRLKYPDPRSASLDHIVPLNKGGDHVWSNVQLAHFGCNSGKRDHGGGQLRLALAAA
jgi:5-methylcytosine-specific restriction endonuclease McrA